MRVFIQQKLREELSIRDKSEVQKHIKTYIGSSDFNSIITRIVADSIKNEKGLEDKVVEITRNVLVQLYKVFWQRRGMWVGQLKNRSV